MMGFKKKKEEKVQTVLKIKSTVYPDNKEKSWYGISHKQSLLNNVFEKL